MERNQKQLQHGDVLLKRIEVLPEGCNEVVREQGRLILARGEATGHHHAIADKEAVLWELKGELYLEATAPVTITHEEHKAIPIPLGIYKIGHVQEHDYFADIARLVRD